MRKKIIYHLIAALLLGCSGTTSKTYYDTGELESEYFPNEQIGKVYYKSGALQRIDRFQYGELHGMVELFSEDSSTYTQVFFDKGEWKRAQINEMDGDFITYQSDTSLIYRITIDSNITYQFSHKVVRTGENEFEYEFDSTLIFDKDSILKYRYWQFDFDAALGIFTDLNTGKVDTLTAKEFKNLGLFESPW